MIDPFTALSVAATVIQFVDFGSRLLIEGYGVYKSAGGAQQEDVENLQLLRDLDELCVRFTTRVSATRRTADEVKLEQLAKKCQRMARDLFDLLERLKVTSTGALRTWDAARKTIVREVKKSKIDKLRSDLIDIKVQLNTHLLSVLQDTQSSIMHMLADLTTTTQTLRVEFAANLDVTRAELVCALDSQGQDVSDLTKTAAKLDITAAELVRALESQGQDVSDMKELAVSELNNLARDTKVEMEEWHRTLQAYELSLRSYEQSISEVSARLDAFISRGSSVATLHQILDSLRFPEMPIRHLQIMESYNNTFSWIFSDQQTPFRAWLENQTGIFWVSGKAGSGKSTLMKFLNDHPRTRSILNSWAQADNKQLVMASFYFWNAGLPMQKKREGLLRSLLFQIFRQCPQLVPEVCSMRWEAGDSFHRNPTPWNHRELAETMTAIVAISETKLPVKICIFIDGLDEYEGRHEGSFSELLELLECVAQSPAFKICVSSRPWTEFKDAYGDNNNRLLVLEYLTRNDMNIFVRGLLGRNRRFMHLAAHEPAAQGFINEILDKAHGVFLWVYLVVTSLLRGLEKHDDIRLLHQRLREIPEDLGQYFDLILKSVEKTYQELTARTFQLAIQAMPLPATAFWYLPMDIRDPEGVLNMPIRHTSPSEDVEMITTATHCINAWCRDLLEVRSAHSTEQYSIPGAKNYIHPETTPANAFTLYKVDFLHRTVRDWLVMGEPQKLLNDRIEPGFNPWLTLVRLYLWQAKSLKIDQSSNSVFFFPFLEVAGEMMFFARASETHSRASSTVYLDELDRVGQHMWEAKGGCSDGSHWTSAALGANSNFLAYAVSFGLTTYVQDALSRDRRLLSRKGDWPLLYCVLQNHVTHPRLDPNRTPELDMLQFLLNKGAQVNDVSASFESPWQRFLSRCYETGDEGLLPAAKILLQNGADVDVMVAAARGGVMLDAERVGVLDCLQRCCRSDEWEEIRLLIEEAPKKAGTRTLSSSLWRRVGSLLF